MSQDRYELLHTALEYAQRLNQGTIQASQYYRDGQFAKAHEYVAMITDGLEWLVNAVALTQDLLTQEVDVTVVNDLIAEYIEAVENDDIVLMADLLEYEIAETIQGWCEVLEETVQKNIGTQTNEA
ncbi:MAG: hypothetical protein J6F30_17565 [Cellulosilyticum sp.]|nr:hypothetical protein [Cellulosilyticum sp.]